MNPVAAAVVPVFGTVALGFVLTRARVFGAATGEGLVRFMYYLAIPAMLFRALSTAELPPAIPWRFLAAFYLPSLALFAVAAVTAPGLPGWTRESRGAAGLSASYSNMVLLGLPLVLGALGADAALPLFILLSMQSTLMFPLVTWMLERDAPSPAAGRAVLRLAFNPILVALALGLSANLAGFTAPATLDQVLALLGRAGPGCALVALGISLAGYRLRGGLGEALVPTALKTIAHPVLVWFACSALGVASDWRAVAVLLAAMPTGINAFVFASRYGVGQQAVAKVVVLSTFVSTVTATLLIAWLRA